LAVAVVSWVGVETQTRLVGGGLGASRSMGLVFRERERERERESVCVWRNKGWEIGMDRIWWG
jgi:hypothetical protein